MRSNNFVARGNDFAAGEPEQALAVTRCAASANQQSESLLTRATGWPNIARTRNCGMEGSGRSARPSGRPDEQRVRHVATHHWRNTMDWMEIYLGVLGVTLLALVLVKFRN